MKNIFIIIAMLFVLLVKPVFSENNSKKRLIVLTDIENEPDDTQSMIRLLLYSNDIDIKGLIATTSCWLRTSVHPESIKKVIEAYRSVLPNLRLHDPAFPSTESLLSTVKQGLPIYGMQGVGQGKSSEGSEWIIKILEEPDERPLWISVWGGSNTLAQALYTINQTKPKVEVEKLISKLRVYTISDQDDSGIWIRNNFPTLFYIVSPGDEYGNATWIAMNEYFEGANNNVVSNSWLAENIQQGHGPLGTNYPDVAYGMEGDTPSWLSLINNGLNNPEHPEWGGWGGRYEKYKPDFSKQKKGTSGVLPNPKTREIWTNASVNTPLTFLTTTGEQLRLVQIPIQGIKLPSGGGGKISSTILQPVWTGALNPTAKPITRRLQNWLLMRKLP